ncbi:SufB/SufD family protein [Butyrivibrio hungatei]|uniref:SufB/SufD family protein n=1 Tax=Butyrivibrio hungatei TaxID=185008 RepID=UPI00041370A4|nr:SufD family Fe-S cluster assembly protein [Butyrivibrio hungatei]
MNKDLNMKVNVLPVLTYGFLKVNDSTVSESDIKIDSFETPDASKMPQGVDVKRGVDFAKAGEIFIKNKDRIMYTTGEFAGPNADTTGRNDGQAIRTGMGIDVDELMISAGAKCDIYTVEENVKVSEPVIIEYKMKDGEGCISSQVIHAKKDSEISVILVYESEKEFGGFHGISTRLLAEEGAKINIYKIQMLGDKFIHFDDIGGACFKGGSIGVTTLELGAEKTWTGCLVNLVEKDAELISNMGYLVRYNNFLDVNYIADQRGKNTNSVMHAKGVLMDSATKVFRGTIDFKNGSSGSAGDEQEDTLMLSPDVVNRSMPVILCQEEDVDGRHGATIGQLGEDLLFYMQTRGIDEENAKRMMIRARLDSVARTIPDKELEQRVIFYIQNII